LEPGNSTFEIADHTIVLIDLFLVLAEIFIVFLRCQFSGSLGLSGCFGLFLSICSFVDGNIFLTVGRDLVFVGFD
jgi:hypothetical protein